MKKAILVVVILVVILGFIMGGIYIYKNYEDYKESILPSREVIAYSDELYLIVEEIEVKEEDAVVFYEDILYFSLGTISTYVDSDLFYDGEEKTLIYTDDQKVIRYKIDDFSASINNKEYLITNPIKFFNEKVYIPVDILLKNYELEISYFENTNAVVLDFTNFDYLKAEVILNDAVIRTDLDIKAPIIADELPTGTIVNVYGEYEFWYKVRTIDGIPGFIEKKYLKINYTKDIYKVEIPKEEKDMTKKKINLTWDYTYRKVTDTSKISSIPGVSVISPTWFSVNDPSGEIYDKGNHDYVSKYLDLGYEIWPLIDNDFNPDLTHELLSKTSSREKLINDILEIYKTYDFQGINIDFENVHLKTKDFFTQFVRELYPLFKEEGMMVSLDVTGMSNSENWSMFYDRARLSEVTDYMVLMAYDQHWAASPVAGSVAEYPWVERSINGVLKYIPHDKLVLAVPYYSRLWLEKDGKVSSQALTMETANKFIKENNIDLVWDEYSLQYYGELEKNETLYKIWLENSKSLEYKASLIHKYDLAGVASWRKGFETEDIWVSLANVLD